MAKESMKARERKRQRLVEKYADKRAALKEAGGWEALQKLPKNSSAKNKTVIAERGGISKSKIKEQIRKWRKTVTSLINLDSSKN